MRKPINTTLLVVTSYPPYSRPDPLWSSRITFKRHGVHSSKAL